MKNNEEVCVNIRYFLLHNDKKEKYFDNFNFFFSFEDYVIINFLYLCFSYIRDISNITTLPDLACKVNNLF